MKDRIGENGVRFLGKLEGASIHLLRIYVQNQTVWRNPAHPTEYSSI